MKRHEQRRTRRLGPAEDYHGCLVVVVRHSRELYWLIDAVIAAVGGPGDVEEAYAR